MSLRSRVLAGLALVAVVLGVVMVVMTRTTRANMLDQVDTQLASAVGPTRGFDFGGGPAPDHGGDDGGGDDRRLSSLYVGHVDGGRVETFEAPNLNGSDTALPVISAGEATAAASDGRAFTVGSDRPGVRYRARAYRDPRAGVVVLALPIDAVDHAVSGLVAVEAVGGGVILLTLGLVAWWVIHLGVRPVRRMTTAAAAIGSGDLSDRVPEARPGTEAGELGAALNRMLGRIEDAFAERARAENRLRQFVADASHELRTPVATVRGYAELYRTGGLFDGAALDDAMRRTEQEAIRMGALVDDLLHLARLDQGRPLERGAVDLVVLADDAARDARAVDPSRAVTAISGDGPLTVHGDEGRLRQVVANIVGNALVHTPPGTPIEITTSRGDSTAVLAVRDHGPGMPPDVAARAFERFYRADPARSRHRGGSGLGLSIVEATVGAHGGSVRLETAPGEGTTVVVELPIAYDADDADESGVVASS
jgi:two-component system OmpR family sensor kinase